jgi:proline iminopeptidase
VGRLYPVEWDAFRIGAHARPGQRVVEAYYHQLTDSDPQVRAEAAEAWDCWEHAHISLGRPKRARLPVDMDRRQVFATLVTHYWTHAAFLPDDTLIDGMGRLGDIPGVLIQGKLDVSGPAGVAWDLHKRWPNSRFILIDDEGHGGQQMTQQMIAAVAEFGLSAS